MGGQAISSSFRCTICAATRRGDSRPSAAVARQRAHLCARLRLPVILSWFRGYGSESAIQLFGQVTTLRKVASLTVYGACGPG